MESLIESIKSSEIPWLFMLITVATFLITYLAMQRYPRLINPSVTSDMVMKEDIDVSKVQFKEYGFSSQIVKNMMCLRDYDYSEHKDLTFLDCEWITDKFNNDTDKFYMVVYDEKPMGYFIVRNNGSQKYEITEFYASHFIDTSFRTLYLALKKYLNTLNKASICIKDVGCLDIPTKNIIEIIIKDCTDANYELIGTGKTEGKPNYNICFKV